ncbi:MAG: hypothetical protein AAGA58_19425 [Verrucomicrobiota bacterium]
MFSRAFYLILPLLVSINICSCKSSGIIKDQSADHAAVFDPTPSALAPAYVISQKGEKQEVDRVIADELKLRKIPATYGPKEQMPPGTKTYITYEDRWMWDITMYLLQLDMQVYDAATNTPLATAHSRRTSMVRKSKEAMVKEVIDYVMKVEKPQ